jgi:hypothetical protein
MIAPFSMRWRSLPATDLVAIARYGRLLKVDDESLWDPPRLDSIFISFGGMNVY